MYELFHLERVFCALLYLERVLYELLYLERVLYELAPRYGEEEDYASLVWIGERPTYIGKFSALSKPILNLLLT